MYKMIPVQPGTFEELKKVKEEAEKEVGARIPWDTFVLGAIVGIAGTAAGIAIAKAITTWLEERKSLQRGGEK